MHVSLHTLRPVLCVAKQNIQSLSIDRLLWAVFPWAKTKAVKWLPKKHMITFKTRDWRRYCVKFPRLEKVFDKNLISVDFNMRVPFVSKIWPSFSMSVKHQSYLFHSAWVGSLKYLALFLLMTYARKLLSMNRVIFRSQSFTPLSGNSSIWFIFNIKNSSSLNRS